MNEDALPGLEYYLLDCKMAVVKISCHLKLRPDD